MRDRPIDGDLLDMLSAHARAARPRRGFEYASLPEALLSEGTAFPYEPYTPDEEELLLGVFGEIGRPWRPKRCFYNAQWIAIEDCRLGYAEGYVLRLGLPLALEHGWNFIPGSGKPVDVTLQGAGEKETCDPGALVARAVRNLENAYLGVPIPKDEVRKVWVRTGRSEALLFLPDVAVGIMRRGFPKAWSKMT